MVLTQVRLQRAEESTPAEQTGRRLDAWAGSPPAPVQMELSRRTAVRTEPQREAEQMERSAAESREPGEVPPQQTAARTAQPERARRSEWSRWPCRRRRARYALLPRVSWDRRCFLPGICSRRPGLLLCRAHSRRRW